MRTSIAVLACALASACNFFDDYLDGEWEGVCTATGAEPVAIYLKFGGAEEIAGETRFNRGVEAVVAGPKGHWESYVSQGGSMLTIGATELPVSPRFGECRSPVCHAGTHDDEGVYPSIDAGIYPRGTFFVSITPPFNTDGQLLLYGELDDEKTQLAGPCRWEVETAAGVTEHVGTGSLTKTSSCYLTKGLPSFVCDDPP